MHDPAQDPAFRDALIAVQDAERARIAGELHDELGQLLTSLRLSLAELSASLALPEQQDLACDLEALSAQALHVVRGMSHALHPPLLQRAGLAAALEAMCERQDARGAVRCTLQVPAGLPRLPDALELAVYRIAQEALGNALRHARATQIEVSLLVRARTLQLTVRDDGAGYDVDAPAGFGRRGMQARAAQHAGQLHERSDAQGTCVRASFPLDEIPAA
ncbi:sensor histidine kinase [Pseudoxanthomonas winnipegensis]|jgi:two-component system NarL family sensor kinase|uniref:histidine kinase n=1 Tax=Pseudoxanthomonas winnipegensis TaxID=2480810 RepID=A0A4Q8LGP4_9GAMM|nr:sensor histidine kinase [Pseudoxanthomonas winnipegensis]TAA28652.1 sensor histidine kinase [Pseudoxanthomonas winnipegensis]